MEARRLISIVTPCFNEEGNVDELHRRIALQMEAFPQYDVRHIHVGSTRIDDLRYRRGHA